MPVRTPDGRTLTVEGTPEPFTTGWGFMLWVNGDGGAYRIHTGPAGVTELVARHRGDFSRFTVREASWKGARLVSHEDPKISGTTMLWIGPHHELYTFVAGTSVPFEVFMDQLSKVDLQDSPDGLVLTPRAGSRARLSSLIAVNTLDGICSVQVKPRSEAAPELPDHAGRRVRGGELWKDDKRAADGGLFRSALLVNDTTATTLIAAKADDPRFAAVADSITCGLN
jgi:hypothetical protein